MPLQYFSYLFFWLLSFKWHKQIKCRNIFSTFIWVVFGRGGEKKRERQKPAFNELQFRGTVDNAPISVLLVKLCL